MRNLSCTPGRHTVYSGGGAGPVIVRDALLDATPPVLELVPLAHDHIAKFVDMAPV